MENVYYGEFTTEEKAVLDTLSGQWVFWKVQSGKRYGFYAWNTEWPKDNRVVAGDFVEMYNTLNAYCEAMESQPEEEVEEKAKEKAESSREPTYHPVGTTPVAAKKKPEYYISGPEVSWEDLHDEAIDDYHEADVDEDVDEDEEVILEPRSTLTGSARLDALMDELDRIKKNGK